MPGSDSAGSDSNKRSALKSRRRVATVYDAVAERVNANGFIKTKKRSFDYESEDSDESTSAKPKGKPVRPDEVLFRRGNAPERYEEDDIYEADRQLDTACELPDSDLLKAIHVYASDYFDRATRDGGRFDFYQMDESALLACGILLEEACRDVLGEDGDLVFTMAAPLDTANRRSSPSQSSISSSSTSVNYDSRSSDGLSNSDETQSNESDGSTLSDDG